MVDLSHQDVLTGDGLVLAGDLLLQLLSDGHAVGHVARRRQDAHHAARRVPDPDTVTCHQRGVPRAVGQKALNRVTAPVSAACIASFSIRSASGGHIDGQGR